MMNGGGGKSFQFSVFSWQSAVGGIQWRRSLCFSPSTLIPQRSSLNANFPQRTYGLAGVMSKKPGTSVAVRGAMRPTIVPDFWFSAPVSLLRNAAGPDR